MLQKKMKNFYSFIALLLIGFSVPTAAQTTGTLTFTFTTPIHTSGNYVSNGRYVLAVWIESCTPCGTTAGTSTFVKSKVRNVGSGTKDHLPTWCCKAGGSCVAASSNALASTCNTVSATTGATLTTFTAKTVVWDGTNVAGANVTNGSYRVCVQETWGHGSATATRYFPFTKGTATDSQTPASDTNFTNISLVWAPTLANETFTQGPEVLIYPNPSNGIFKMDFKTEVKNIRVFDMLGGLVYTENVYPLNSETTKEIDLSNASNGIYFVNVSDDNGTSSYKIVLNK